ncbi:MAG: hypothetical protein GYA56_13690 [Geobacteraceae bacterium]|nr:hypothetical protein [Geobacteraceae bacterium]
MVFVTDTFTDANGTSVVSHTGELGASWTRQTGYEYDAVIQNGRLAGYLATATAGYASGVPGSPDYSVSADLYVVSDTSGRLSGVTGRASTSAFTFYLARYLRGSGWQLFKYVGGTFTQLGSSVAQPLTLGATYRMELRMSGNVISLYVDGQLLITQIDSAISAAGRAGYRLTGTPTTGYHLDNLRAETPQSGAEYAETVADTAVMVTVLEDMAARAESLLTLCQAADSAQDAVARALVEDLATAASSAAFSADVMQAVDSLRDAARSSQDVAAFAVRAESLLTVLQAAASAYDARLGVQMEEVFAAAQVSASETDVQTVRETLLSLARSGAAVADMGAFIDQVRDRAAGAAGVSDAVLSALVAVYGAHVRSGAVAPRLFSHEARPRRFVSEVPPC